MGVGGYNCCQEMTARGFQPCQSQDGAHLLSLWSHVLATGAGDELFGPTLHLVLPTLKACGAGASSFCKGTGRTTICLAACFRCAEAGTHPPGQAWPMVPCVRRNHRQGQGRPTLGLRNRSHRVAGLRRVRSCLCPALCGLGPVCVPVTRHLRFRLETHHQVLFLHVHGWVL